MHKVCDRLLQDRQPVMISVFFIVPRRPSAAVR
jgi:hypothetical protein